MKIGAVVMVLVVSIPLVWVLDPLAIDASGLNWAVQEGDEIRVWQGAIPHDITLSFLCKVTN